MTRFRDHTPEERRAYHRAAHAAWRKRNPKPRRVHPGWKLDKDTAQRLRDGDLKDLPRQAAALRFGCSPGSIDKARRGDTWIGKKIGNAEQVLAS